MLSREHQDVPVLNRYLDGAKVRRLLSGLADTALIDYAFVCGPAGILTQCRRRSLRPAWPPSECLTPRAPTLPRLRLPAAAVATPHALAVAISDGIRTEVPVGAGVTVLDAALRTRLDLSYSWRGGMCGTCRARVTEGSVEMG